MVVEPKPVSLVASAILWMGELFEPSEVDPASTTMTEAPQHGHVTQIALLVQRDDYYLVQRMQRPYAAA